MQSSTGLYEEAERIAEEAQADVRVGQGDVPEGQAYVFVIGKGPNVGQRMKRSNVWQDFDVVRRRTGVPRRSLHDLRRSFCTNLSGAVPMHVVQELAGHSDIRTTRRYYLKVEPELMDAAREALEVVLEGRK